MNLNFSTAHMQTLCELKELAEKHNCYISFGTRNSSGPALSNLVLVKNGFTPDEIARLDELEKNEEHFDDCCVWFELYDRNKLQENILTYYEMRTSFYYDQELQFFGTNRKGRRTLRQKLQESEYAEGHFASYCTSFTQIRNFEEKGVKENHIVYRPDMALKFFGDYVCDYLGEPRIKRVY